MSKDDLIDRLRIDPAAADERRRPGWISVALVVVVLILAAAGWAWHSRGAHAGRRGTARVKAAQ